MLSIVIPIFNRDVRPLVTTLMKQCAKLNINYQILCFDDFSEQKYKDLNKELAFRINVNYTEMQENLGRSRIRNWLGKAAFYEYVLFLDCDSVVKDKDFVKNYITHLPFEGIIYGGTSYTKTKPRSKKKILHWKYGIKREAAKAKKRNKSPYMDFHSNNFLIPERIFKQFPFDEKVIGYGYEDLLYAFDLQKRGIPVFHIDNPVIHDGLEINTLFIKKTENAINNLATLYKSKRIPGTRLTKSYEKLKAYHLLKSFAWTYQKLEAKIVESIHSDDPSISYFNMWKLHLFIQKLKNN